MKPRVSNRVVEEERCRNRDIPDLVMTKLVIVAEEVTISAPGVCVAGRSLGTADC